MTKDMESPTELANDDEEKFNSTVDFLEERLPPEGKEDSSQDISCSFMLPNISKQSNRYQNKQIASIQERAMSMLDTNKSFNTKSSTGILFAEISQLPIDDLEQYLIYLLCKKQEQTKAQTMQVKLKSKHESLSLLTRVSLLKFPSQLSNKSPEDENNFRVDLISKHSMEKQTKSSTQSFSRLEDFFTTLSQKVYKVFQATDADCGERDRRIYLVISSGGVYFIPKRESSHHKTCRYVLYEDIESILVGCFGQWLMIKSKQLDSGNTLCADIGDHMVTKCIVSGLEVCARRRITALRQEKVRKCVKPSRKLQWQPTFQWMHNEVKLLEIALRKSAVIDVRTSVIRSWMVLSEEGDEYELIKQNSFCLEGHFMMKVPGIFAKWKPSYFILTEKILYQFGDVTDKEPKRSTPTKEFCGCLSLELSRPHCFQIELKNGKCLQLAAADQTSELQWLQKINHIINRKVPISKGRSLKPSQLVLTTAGLLLLPELGAELMRRLLALPKDFAVPKTNPPKSASRHLAIPRYQKLPARPKEDVPERLPPCPPTPPRLHLAPEGLDKTMRSSVYLDQISAINICEICPSACIIELECSEALQMIHDWLLHFPSETELSTFLRLSLKHYREVTYKTENVIQELAPNLNHFLVEGSAMASDYWN